MFNKILIANRGEIACRIAATCRRLGIRTVAVYSDADSGARHVAECDEAFRLGPAPARESYLRGDTIIDVARRSGAEAIHPGYGFLSENEAFAAACAAADLVFIGPPPAAINAMGLKAESKRLMADAGVPLVPGYHGADQDPVLLAREAAKIGYPVLIKASAGGGGKGMRIVRAAEEFETMLASCQREARASFGNEDVLVEKYLTRPRHIEIQVFCDRHGNAIHLFERDCSVQRRHQKVVEEAPAPGMTPERRRAMGEAAVAAAKAVGYEGAGTVEFITDADGSFFFMEMNTRLQVEHPVTEMITGLDLVEWQLRVAAGEALPATQDAVSIHGHSIEARIYAENPDKGFLPSIGRLAHLRTPAAVQFRTGASPAPVRIDSGVRQGDSITPHYDPMIAKLIVWGEDRQQAILRMRSALAHFEVVGPATNADFLGRLMHCRAFVEADLDTALIEREREVLLPPAAPPTTRTLALATAAVLASEGIGNADDPWSSRNGWRMNGRYRRPLVFTVDGGAHAVEVEYAGDGYTVHHDGESTCLADLALAGTDLTGLIGSERFAESAIIDGESLHLFTADGHASFGYAPALAHAGDDSAAEGQLIAPMPGKVIAVLVESGTVVARGEPLLVMEAMKMEHTITAPAKGRVEHVMYRVGDQVAEGVALVALGPAD